LKNKRHSQRIKYVNISVNFSATVTIQIYSERVFKYLHNGYSHWMVGEVSMEMECLQTGVPIRKHC